MKMPRWVAACLAAALASVPAAAMAKTTVCPGPTTVDGNDVSFWQGTMDWGKIKAAGRKYVIMRAAHAMSVDTKFDFNWKSCHDQGLHCGVYQFFEPNIDPVGQADLMLAKMGKLGPGDLPPVIDVESTGGGMAASAVADAVGKWINHVQAKTGVKPMIYSGGYFWEDNVKSTAFGDYPLWHPQYCSNCCPNIANPWKKWYYWQYSSTGKVNGISGNVDMDLWNGTQAALDAWAIQGAACALHCEGAVLVKADCSKTDCGKSGDLCVVDDLGGRCYDKNCPPKGDKQICVPSPNNALVGTCKNGELTTGDCSKYGAFCSTAAAAQAKCVSAFCAGSPTEKPAAKDVCLPDGKRYACAANGDIAEKPCAAGTSCKMDGAAAICQAKTCDPHCEGATLVGGDCKKTDCAGLPEPQKGTCADDDKGARCVSAYCPAKGQAQACSKDLDAAIVCNDGSAVATLCLAGEQVCGAKVPGGAACADKVCLPNPAAAPISGKTCLPGDTILACTANGLATLTVCPDGQSCEVGAPIAACKEPAPEADAGGAGNEPDGGAADAGPATDAAAGTGAEAGAGADGAPGSDGAGVAADASSKTTTGGSGGGGSSSSCSAGSGGSSAGALAMLLAIAAVLAWRRRWSGPFAKS